MSEKRSKPRITMEEVPSPEEVKVIDMKVGELFLGVCACLTIAGVAYTYYTHIKTRSDERRIEAIARAVSVLATEISKTIPKNDDDRIIPIIGKKGKRKAVVAQA